MKKTETKSTVLLRHHLKALKLPTMNAECEKISQRCATDNRVSLLDRLQCYASLVSRVPILPPPSHRRPPDQSCSS